jgi:hypothetical protein
LLYNLKIKGIQDYFKGLTPTQVTDYSLRKATRKMKRPQHHITPIRINHNTWTRTDKQKATAFAEQLASVCQPILSQLSGMEEETFNTDLNTPHQMVLPMKIIQINEVKNVTQYKINPKKIPGYNFITGKFLKELSQKGLRAITQVYNAILQTEYLHCQWKVGQIIIIVKPGKKPNDVPYRPIILLQLLSKIPEITAS